MLDDQALLHAYVSQGSSEAFTRLVERHAGLVYGAALRRVGGDPHRARDVSQRVFVDLARKAPRLVRHPVLAGWLHRSTQWAASSERRAEQRRTQAEQAAAFAGADEIAVAAGREWAEVRLVLDEALDSLRSADREAILLRFFHDLSYPEVARQTGCSENAARMRVERALARLETILQRKGITSTAAALGGLLAQNAVAAPPPGLAAGLASNALAASAGAGTTGLAGLWLSSVASHIPLVLVTVIAGVLTWGLLDARAAANQAREEVEGLKGRKARATQAVAGLEAAGHTQAAPSNRFPPLSEMPVPTAVQLERRRLDLLIRKGELDRTYAALFRRLRLPPETLDRFKELLVNRNQAIYDALQVVKAEGVTLDYAEDRQLMRAAVAPVDLQISALLGTDAAEVRRFLDTFDFRMLLMLPGIAGAARERAVAVEGWVETSLPQLEAWLLARQRSAAYVPLPDSLERELRQLLTPEEIAERESLLEWERIQGRMDEIAREAAYAGKLKLSAKSERDYRPASKP